MHVLVVLCCIFLGWSSAQVPIKGFRPPAVPLIVMDPYMNIWSMADNLTDDWPKYWPGTVRGMVGLIRIDGSSYRFLGPANEAGGTLPPPLKQDYVTVFPTQTVYSFSGYGINLLAKFTTPSLAFDFDVLSRPITYITFTLSATDGKNHNVQIYYDATAETAVNNANEQVMWERANVEGLTSMRIGTTKQDVLGLSGDGVGINWGYLYISAPTDSSLNSVMFGALEARTQFVNSGTLPPNDDYRMPREASDDWPVLALSWNLQVRPGSATSKYLLFAYDDIFSIKYFGAYLRPYWYHLYNQTGDIRGLLTVAVKQYESLLHTCDLYDKEILQETNAAGGPMYATLAALAYRQVMGASKLVWNEEQRTMWYFMKEISSDGDLSTVDVIFPASPFLLHANVDLLSLLMPPILQYANNETYIRYNQAFAPHHLGFWPVGDILPKDQENMPIEETGNMFMMLAAIAKKKGNMNDFYPKYKNLFEIWGQYLVSSLPDPGNQLCTDDFEGPIPHDSNLAVKGIVALDCYAFILKTLGNSSGYNYYHTVAKSYAQKWLVLANPENTDHYRLRYDLPGFSLKYNLLYQKILGLDTFPESVFSMELKYYINSQWKQFGVPLDNRHDFTKLDWECWVAAISPDKSYFDKLVSAAYAFANKTPQRVPLSDWYNADDATQMGFQARSVVGGIYAKMVV